MKLFSFDGKAKRREWWLYQLGWWAVMFVAVQTGLLGKEDEEPGAVAVILFIISMLPLLAVQVRRWHDRGKSGFWVFINVVPVIGSIWAFIELGFCGTFHSFEEKHPELVRRNHSGQIRNPKKIIVKKNN